MARTMQIVVAWMTTGMEFVRERRTDLGERPVMREVMVPHAVMWLKRGTEADALKACAYAASMTDVVRAASFAYCNERDPLSAAKRDILKHAAL